MDHNEVLPENAYSKLSYWTLYILLCIKDYDLLNYKQNSFQTN